MVRKNIEIEKARHLVDLLMQYESAKIKQEKDALLNQIAKTDFAVYEVLLNTPSCDIKALIQKIDKAIELDRYRPKNISIDQLAISKDLDYTGGKFSTFDVELSKMVQRKAPKKIIRKRFETGMKNLDTMIKMFSNEWISRLHKHQKLVKAARNATKGEAIDAYRKLFSALTKDFCNKYDCHIETQVITSWKEKAKGFNNNILGNTSYSYVYGKGEHRMSKNTIALAKSKILHKLFTKQHNEFLRKWYGGKISFVDINIAAIRKHYSETDDFFYAMVGTFVHEMHHALEYEHPNKSPLGAQIQHVDKDIYTHPWENQNENTDSAMEKSSYGIQHELVRLLKKERF